MVTKLTAKNKLETINTINQAITLCNLAADGVIFSIGKTESAKLSELESVNWNDLRLLLKNLDSTTFYYEIEKGIRVDVDTQWNDSTQRLTIQSIGDIEKIAKPIDVNPDISETKEEISNTSIQLDLDHFSLFIAVKNTENKTVKKKIDFSYELENLVKGWLVVNKHSHKFTKTAHNALTIFPYPAYEWVIQIVKGVPQIRKKPIISENGQELRNRSKSIILKRGRPPIPEVSNLLLISPIKEETGGEVYITQTYIEKDSNGNYQRKSRRIAWFDKDGGSLVYYVDIESNYKSINRTDEEIQQLTQSDPIVTKHLLEPLVSVGENIYPDLSIREIKLQNLVPDSVNWDREDESRQFWVNEIQNLHKTITGERVGQTVALKTKLKTTSGNQSAFSPKSVLPSITFHGAKHPNIEEKKIPQHQRLESNKPKPYLLDGSKAVSGELHFKGVLGTVPCILKMTAKGRLYDIQALPVKVNEFALGQYITYHQPKLIAMAYLERTIKKYQAMNVNLDKLREKNELITLLEALLRDLISGVKPSADDVLAATKTIEKYLSDAQYHSLVDEYYRFHNLGTGQFVQEVEDERYQYLVRDYGKNYRRGTGSDINSVINWVRNCPHNLNTRFGHKAAEINEISEYLDKSFKDRFPSKTLQLAIYERGEKFLEVYYKGGLEIQQRIDIISPTSKAKKETNLIGTNTNFKPEWATDLEFKQFLQCSEYESALIISTREQVRKMVQKYIRSNYGELTGKGKVFKETRIAQIVGFNQCNTRYGGVVKTFLKYTRPYLDQSAPNILKGELINLDTLKTYAEKDAYNLIGEMTNQWKTWKHKDQEIINLGGIDIKKPDPGTLMLAVSAAIYKNPQHDQIIWRDLIDVFYQLSGYPLGFRASNGVVLTPHHFYDSGVTRHTHRIKLQLIDLLRKEQKTKQDKAHNSLKLATTTEEKQKSLEQVELIKVINPGSIEAWLQQPIKKLYDNLESLDPQWGVNLANLDILKHLEAMHDALVLATNAESNP